jgi:hypothetical protein
MGEQRIGNRPAKEVRCVCAERAQIRTNRLIRAAGGEAVPAHGVCARTACS